MREKKAQKMRDMVWRAERFRRQWRRYSIIALVTDYVLTILSFGLSVAIIYIETADKFFTKEDNSLLIIVLASFSAILTLCNFVIQPQKYTRIYRKAFAQLDKQLFKYYFELNNKELSDTKTDVANITEAICEGERIISGIFCDEIDCDR